MNYASKSQITKLHVLLNQFGWIDDKKLYISNATNGRTESSKQLYFEEAKELISNLAQFDPSERLKMLIFSLAYSAGIIYGTTGEDKKINAAKLNLFLAKSGTVKKELNKMSYAELLQTQRQFEAIVRNVAKCGDNKAAGKIVNELLNELDIHTLKA